MGLRGVLVALVVAATAAFVVGVALERGRGSGHLETSATQGTPARGEATVGSGEAHSQSGESGEAHPENSEAANGEAGTEVRSAESGQELRPLGIDVEAWPFVALAAAVSLALAAAAVTRPRVVALLALVAVTMLALAVLDVREVAHQHDEGNGGLAVLAGVVATLHLATAAIAGLMAARARSDEETLGAAGTMPA